jgi:hypothetical protein
VTRFAGEAQPVSCAIFFKRATHLCDRALELPANESDEALLSIALRDIVTTVIIDLLRP